MNQLEFNLIPTRISSEDKEEYIKALVETRETDDLAVFRRFMTDTMIRQLEQEIRVFEKSVGE